MAKKLVLGLILAHSTQIRAAKYFFSKSWLCHSLDVMVSYYHVQYQKKPMIQSWENLVTDGQTDKSDFIGRCPTNVERFIFIRRSIPKKLLKYLKRMNINN